MRDHPRTPSIRFPAGGLGEPGDDLVDRAALGQDGSLAGGAGAVRPQPSHQDGGGLQVAVPIQLGAHVVEQLAHQPPGRPRTMDELKQILREQYLLLRLDQKRAVAEIPKLLPKDEDERARTLRAVLRVISATGEQSEEGKRRLEEIERLFGRTLKKKEEAVERA